MKFHTATQQSPYAVLCVFLYAPEMETWPCLELAVYMHHMRVAGQSTSRSSSTQHKAHQQN